MATIITQAGTEPEDVFGCGASVVIRVPKYEQTDEEEEEEEN